MAAAVLVLVGVAAAGAVTAHRAAEREAVDDARCTTDLLVATVLWPALDDGVIASEPASVAAMDAVVRPVLATGVIVRIKLWTPDGRVVYADEPRLIGARFGLDGGQSEALRSLTPSAGLSDLSRPENAFERTRDGSLLEVYRPVRSPGGDLLLVETYSRYDGVDLRANHLWSSFGTITVISLVALVAVQAPLLWMLLGWIRRSRRDRESALAEAIAVSDAERRHIAATLHDGAVQELAASAYLVAGAADRARGGTDPRTAGQLDAAADSIRSAIGDLRSLLVDIHPPALRGSGLAAALTDLCAPLRARGLAVDLDLPAGTTLPPATEDLVFRVTRELVRNAAHHAAARSIRVALTAAAEPRSTTGTVLEVGDDGTGLDPRRIGAAAPQGHLGTRLVIDWAAAAGADLRVRTAPGAGTTWRMEIPTP